MSVVKRIIKDSIERVQVDELLAEEYEQAGYGGVHLTKTPLGAQINLFAMRPGRVIGKRGRAIKEASRKLEEHIGLSNPQITVIEVEVPELNPQIMASRVANALERGVHFRRAVFWSLNRIMESGALGCEITLRGPLRSARTRFEKVVEGYVPKAGEPALKYVKKATMHVKMKRGILGVTVKIVAPDAKFPDKINLDNLPEIEYQLPVPDVIEETLQSEVEANVNTELETPVLAEKLTELEPNVKKTKISESDLAPTEEEVLDISQDKQKDTESEPLPEVIREEESEKQPEVKEE